jgi:2,3-diketo-5-methylthio-1-phosphopentane phosphatase
MNASKVHKKILVLCDFDGTICTVDMGNEILNRFTGEGWEEIDRAYCADEIGSRDAYTQVTALLRGTKPQMLEYARIYEKIDPHFNNFYQFCTEEGIDLKIVSDGLDFYIDAILRKHNLQDIEFFSNVVVFRDGSTHSIEFPRMNTAAPAKIVFSNSTDWSMTASFTWETVIQMCVPRKMQTSFLPRTYCMRNAYRMERVVYITIISVIFVSILL